MRTRKLMLLAVIAACLHCGGEDATISTTSQALGPTPFEVMPDADTAYKYAEKCGLADHNLPATGTPTTPTTPIRGTINPADVGTLVSNGWRLIQSFNNNATDLASAKTLKANLWYKKEGGRDWYYLYRFEDPDPKVQTTLNGVLGFDATSICAFDRIGPPNPPPPSIDYLYYAGQTEDPDLMDDCSACHVQGYNAPRTKSLAVAKDGTAPTANPVKWLLPWKVYAAKFGPQWKLGKAPTAYKWVSGQGTAPLTTDASCESCHGTKWIKPLDNKYCKSVFETAFDTNGSMLKQGSKFGTLAECTAFVAALGCDTAICPTATAAAPPLPRINETTLLVGDIKVIDSTTVQITPTQNPANIWVAGTTSAIGDPWVASLQVWGAPYTGSPTSTSAMTGVISISSPNALSPILVTGLNPSTQYIFQLNVTDADGSSALSPTAIISTSTAADDFLISPNPSSLTVTQGTSGTSAINTVVTSGNAQSVSLSISGVPSGASASFSPNPIVSGGSSTLTINGGTAAPSTYTLTVTGTGAYGTHTTIVTVTVASAALAVSPSQVTLAVGTSQTFTASGGSGAGYTWDLATNNSGGAITAAGVYTAGATGGVTDVVRVTDSANHTATANVTVGLATGALAVSPSQVTVAVGASQTFTASGGSGTGYTWDLATNNSGGAITAAGVYTAGATGGVTDVVRVTDSANQTATATVTVSMATAALAVSPSQATVAVGASQTFNASGGSGTGYTWDLATNNSGGAITEAGVYTAGSTGGVTDVVRVTDSANHTATATVTVSMATAALAASPSQVTVTVGASQTFTASGGSGTGYTWDLATNNSGGSITAAGVYTAGATGGVTDVVRVTDSANHTAMATVTVPARSVPPDGNSGCSATGARFPQLAFLVLLFLSLRRRRVTA